MIIDTEKAKQALDALEREKQAQRARLQFATEVKREFENKYKIKIQ